MVVQVSPKRAKMLSTSEVAAVKNVMGEVATKAMTLRIKLLSENGRAPERGSAKAAGYDIFRYGVSN